MKSMTYEEINYYFKFYKYNEDSFFESENFLFIDMDNKDAYSFRFSNLLINICTDFESLCKKYFGFRKDVTIEKLIASLRKDSHFASFFNEKIALNGTNYVDLEPLKNDGASFSWWSKNNKLKHDKLNCISSATQWQVVNALAALYALNMYILKALADSESKPDVFLGYSPKFSLSNLVNRSSTIDCAYFESCVIPPED